MRPILSLAPPVALLVVLLAGCGDADRSGDENEAGDIGRGAGDEHPVAAVAGHYVTPSYHQRAEGHDWTAVTLAPFGEDDLRVTVRSRADRKRPTCTFSGVAHPLDDGRWEMIAEHVPIHVELVGDTLRFTTPGEGNEYILHFFCSGGASLAGPYLRLDGELDAAQLGPVIYDRYLNLQDVGFDVTVTTGGAADTLAIAPDRLAVDNRAYSWPLDGVVTGAEIEDLNGDGWPEVVVMLREPGADARGSVRGLTVNAGKSASIIALPPVANDPEAFAGYHGGDEFALVETSLVRRFPVRDDHGEPTGRTRQLQYRLVDGEAGRRFEIARVSEY